MMIGKTKKLNFNSLLFLILFSLIINSFIFKNLFIVYVFLGFFFVSLLITKYGIKIIKQENKLTEGINPIFHWCDDGIASWYDLAIAISEISLGIGLINKKALIEPINSISYSNSLIRPRFSKLDCDYTKKTF